MKKLVMFITIFVSVLFLTNIYNVKALNLDDLPTQEDYDLVYLTMGQTTYTNMICAYTNGTVYCYKGNMSFTPRLFVNSNYINENNPNGYFVTNQVWNWVGNNHSNYYSTSIMYWDSSNRHWYYYCNMGNNTCNNDIPVTSDYTITYYQAWDESDPYTNQPYNYNNGWLAVPEYQSPYYYGTVPSNLPDYLTGYKEVVLNIDEVNVILSGLSSGSIYIPYNSFIESGGRLSYFVKNVPYQKWDTVIDDYYVMDLQFVRQDFDISDYPDASYVMFSKYLYLEGYDDITYSIYIPNDMYSSLLTAELNNNGGYDYTYEVIDENDDIQEEGFTSLDYGISPSSPLLADLFSDFSSNTFGLTAIVTAPLSLISSITSSSCSSLTIPLPYVNRDLTLPCMTTIYQSHFGAFFDIYQTITFGVISYWVIVRIFNLVKDFKNPEHDEIEVLDL